MSIADELTAGQAQYVLRQLLADRKIRERDVTGYLSRMGDEIRSLEQQLETLRSAAGDAQKPARRRAPRGARKRSAGKRRGRAAKATATAAPAAKGRKRRRSKGPLSPEVRASRALQGQYIAYIKQLPAGERDKYKQIAVKKGREEAVRRMKKALGK